MTVTLEAPSMKPSVTHAPILRMESKLASVTVNQMLMDVVAIGAKMDSGTLTKRVLRGVKVIKLKW